MKRSPLKIGNVYQFQEPCYPAKVCIHAFSFPSSELNDDGLSGVSIHYLDNNVNSEWHPFTSERQFWADPLFSQLFDVKNN
jgi:hypothetical protein